MPGHDFEEGGGAVASVIFVVQNSGGRCLEALYSGGAFLYRGVGAGVGATAFTYKRHHFEDITSIE